VQEIEKITQNEFAILVFPLENLFFLIKRWKSESLVILQILFLISESITTETESNSSNINTPTSGKG